jgi:predicted phage terminase large subunit-like protein
MAREHPGCRIAIVGATSADARRTMVKGKSGVLRVCPPWELSGSGWYFTDQQVRFRNGSTATLYTADEPERLRGPEHDFAWADELCAWGYPEAWDMLLMTMRGGVRPRVLVTTTPKPSAIIRDLMSHSNTAITIGATLENASNLPGSFLNKILAKYAGTHLGRQELEGEVVVETEGALWTRALVERARVAAAPELVRVVVAVDPSGSARAGGALCGIVVAGVAEDGQVYVLEDASGNMSPDAWARRVVVAYETHRADRVLAESNHGGAMVEAVLGTVGMSVTMVNASRGKYVRAEPVAALYEQGRVRHVGAMPHLEDQMCSWTPEAKGSPDRMDALVYAVTELALESGGLEYVGTIG